VVGVKSPHAKIRATTLEKDFLSSPPLAVLARSAQGHDRPRHRTAPRHHELETEARRWTDMVTWGMRSQHRTKVFALAVRIRASGVRTGARTDRAETGLLPRFLSSVLNRPSQEVWRELASGERIPGVFPPGQSTDLSQTPQETCHSARRPVRLRARLVWELAEEVRPEPNRRCRIVDWLTRIAGRAVPPRSGA